MRSLPRKASRIRTPPKPAVPSAVPNREEAWLQEGYASLFLFVRCSLFVVRCQGGLTIRGLHRTIIGRRPCRTGDERQTTNNEQ
jgi:hypothetical protein